MKDAFATDLAEEYNDSETIRLYYCDKGEIARFIVTQFLNRETSNFQSFFDKVEEICPGCDAEIVTLMGVGLFENIQNIGGPVIDYYSSFDQWLKPISKSE